MKDELYYEFNCQIDDIVKVISEMTYKGLDQKTGSRKINHIFQSLNKNRSKYHFIELFYKNLSNKKKFSFNKMIQAIIMDKLEEFEIEADVKLHAEIKMSLVYTKK